MNVGRKTPIHQHLKNHFIPHEGNGFLPHSIRHRSLFWYSAIFVLVKAVVVAIPALVPATYLLSSAISPENIIALTNQTRKNLNLPELQMNASLERAAQSKAEDMLKNAYFAHTSPAGLTPWYWIKRSGYDYLSAAENLAVHYESSEGVNDGWLASPSHRENIVNAKYREIGIGIARGDFEGFPTTFVVQMFGTPPNSLVTTTTEPPKPFITTTTTPVTPTKPQPTVASAQSEQPPKTPPTNFAQVRTVPKSNGIALQVKTAKPIKAASIVTASKTIPLTPTPAPNPTPTPAKSNQNWQATIPPTTEAPLPGGTTVILNTVDQGGNLHSEPIAVVAPNMETKDLYLFAPGDARETSFFGSVIVKNLQDGVRRFYYLGFLILGAALLLKIFIKIRIQHPSVIVHTLLVMGLAAFLTIL